MTKEQIVALLKQGVIELPVETNELDLTMVNLDGANLKGANLKDADLYGATLPNGSVVEDDSAKTEL